MENQQDPSAAAAAAGAAAEDAHPNIALINSFCEITCASKSEALFFLESHNFDLDAAVSTFLESSSSNPDPSAVSIVDPEVNRSPSRSRSRSPSYSPSLSEKSSPSSPRSRSPSPSRSARRAQYNLRSARGRGKAPSSSSGGAGAGRHAAGGVRTLADLNRRSNDNGSDDSDPDYQPNEYYTGGEKSGMLVQDPSKANDVDAVFNDARQFATSEREPHLPSPSSTSFRGTARLLSGETVAPPPPPPQQPEERFHSIIFWNNGFTVDNGPLRRFDDPNNASFLESIRRSECPKELAPADKSTDVHVSLLRKDENCPVPQKRNASFQGVGRTLGSTSDTNPTGDATAVDTTHSSAPPPTMGLTVDATRPTTSIQLRLGDGTRMVSRFNYSHTIRDIRGFIDASRPGGARTYQLQTVGFPPKQLVDLDQTIEQAGLANSVVIQKLG